MASDPETPKVIGLSDRVAAKLGKAHTAAEPIQEYLPSYLDLEALEEQGEPPAREWALDYWLGMGHVTLLAGAGGAGKSLFAQQLATALVLQRDYISKVREPRRTLMWMGEDDDLELWRRQKSISAKFAVPLSTCRDRLMLESMLDTDCCLYAKIIGAGMVRTGMLTALREEIGDLKAEVVVLDNSAKLFQGNENDRAEVTGFITALNWAAAPTKAAVLLLGHVAKQKGSEYSGSAAWENAVRSRWWLTHKPPDAKENDEEEAPDSELRYLAKRKVNYSSLDLSVLRFVADQWSGTFDVLQAPMGESGLVAAISANRASNIVLAGLTKIETMGLQPTDSSSSSRYLPKLIVEHGLAEGCTKSQLAKAMRLAMTDGLLKREVIGVKDNRHPLYGLVITAPPRGI